MQKFRCLCAAALVVVAVVQSGAAAPGSPKVAAHSQGAERPPYRLAAGDTIDITFFYNSELNQSVQIRPDGRVSLPLVGDLVMEGKTVEQVVQEINQAYGGQLKTPAANVSLRAYAGQKVFVTGEVVRPGVISMPGQLTLLAAIGEAGGIKTTGNVKHVVLITQGPDHLPLALKIALKSHGTYTPDAARELQPFDIVMVPESTIARLDRWVDQNLKQLNPGITTYFGFNYALNNPVNFVPF